MNNFISTAKFSTKKTQRFCEITAGNFWWNPRKYFEWNSEAFKQEKQCGNSLGKH